MPVKKLIIDKANRMYRIPGTIDSSFKIDKKTTFIKKTEYLDLATFNWNCPTEKDINGDSRINSPASTKKIFELKEELAAWYSTVHSVKLNPKNEIYIGGGITNSLTALSFTFIDSGDIIFVPEISIPLYRSIASLAGGEPINYPLSPANNWLPDFEKVNSRLGRVSKFLILNSPSNPTGCELKQKEFERLIFIAAKENIAVINDAAYQTIPDRISESFLSISGSRKVGIELSNFSYHFGLPSMNFGFAVGNKDIISGLSESKRLIRNDISEYFVDLAIDGIRKFPNQNLKEIRKSITKSSSAANTLLDALNLEKMSNDKTPFVWAKIKKRSRAVNASNILKRRSKVLVIPGNKMGDAGEGYLRFSLTASPENYQKAIDRTKNKLQLLRLDKPDELDGEE